MGTLTRNAIVQKMARVVSLELGDEIESKDIDTWSLIE